VNWHDTGAGGVALNSGTTGATEPVWASDADEAGIIEDGDVLLHRGKRHVVAGGERRDRGGFAGEQPGDDVSARAVGEGAEELVELGVGERQTCNHMVV
jgi:hypothetical protein